MARAMAMVMRVEGNKESKGGKAMAMVTRVVGKQMAMATKKVMEMKTKEAGKEERNGMGIKSYGDGKEEGDGEQ